MKSKLVAYVSATLVLSEVLLVLLSWLLSATMTAGVRSLLSSEGVRWFLGHFVDLIQSPVLVWLLLLAMAYGCLRTVWIQASIEKSKVGLRATLLVLSAYVVLVILLALVPHAILLSATGRLFPSPFSHALVPLVAFGMMLTSVVYGLSARIFRSFQSITDSLVSGLASAAPYLLLYVFFMQFYESLRYVFF